MGFDLQGARKEGISEREIAEYLARNRAFDLKGARKEGWSDAEIADYLNARDVVSNEPPLSDPGPRAGRQPGLQVQGNIDTRDRPRVRNADGSISTVRSMSFQDDDGREVLIPTVSDDGRVMSDPEAIEQYRRTGKHLGMFDTPQNATGFAQRLHEDQARRISKPSPHTVPESPMSNAFDPYGGYFSQADRGQPAHAPDDYSQTVAESLADTFGEDFQAPSGADWWGSLRGTLARQLQGYELSQLESLEDEMLGRTWPVGRHGMPKYDSSATPEYLRAVQDDPKLIAIREKIAEAKAAGQEITTEAQDISARNQGFYPQVIMGATNSLAASAPALATTMVTKNPLTSLPMMYGPTAAGSYGEMREANVPRGLADKASTVEGVIEAITEFPAMRPFAAEASPFLRRFGETLAADIPGETIATLGQDVTREIATADPNASTFDSVTEGLRQGLGELPVTYGTVLATAGAHSALGHGIDATREALRDRSSEISAEATRERALASAQDLLNRIRGPQGRLPLDGAGAPPGAPPPQGPTGGAPPPDRVSPTIDMSLLSSVVPQDPFIPELPMPDRTIQPELPIAMMPTPDTTGSPAPEAGGGNRTAPLPPSTQGTASASPAPFSSAFQQQPAAPPASPSPQEPAPTPAPHAAPAVSTAKEPPAGGVADRDFDDVAASSLFHLENDESAPVRVYKTDERGGAPSTTDKPPPWRDIGGGWQVREYNEQIGDKTYPRQEMRQPGGKRYVRGYDLEGKPLDVSPDLTERFNQVFGEREARLTAEREAAAKLPGAKQMQDRRDTETKKRTDKSRDADIERHKQRIAAVAEEVGRLRKEIPADKLPKKELHDLDMAWAHLDIADGKAGEVNAMAMIADRSEKALEALRAAKPPARPKPTAVPTPPKQATMFDEEGKPAEGAAQVVPEPAEGTNDTPRGGWPKEGSWINAFSDGTLPDQELNNQLVNESNRLAAMSGVTDPIRKKLAKAHAGIKNLYPRYSELGKEAGEKVSKDSSTAIRYRLQEMATETDPKALAEYAEGLRGMLQGAIEHREYNIKETKRVARDTPKAKPAAETPAPAQVTPEREPTGGDQVTPQPYGSGMSRPNDLRAAVASPIGAGVVATELSENAMEGVADAVAAGKEVFVDSGAFSAFKAAIKAGKPNATKADFDKVFTKYNKLIEKVKARTTFAQRGLLTVVAPDVVGDQTASLALLRKHAEEVKQWMEDGFEVIVPFQRGPLPQSEVYKQVADILGGNDFVVGIPSNAAAMSNEEFAELLSQPYKPDRIHILGAVNSPRVEERMKVIREQYKEEVPGVTTDANLIRSKTDELRGLKGEDRVRAIKDILERSATDTQKAMPPIEPKPAETPKKLQPKEVYPQASEDMPVREIVPGGEVEGEHGEIVQMPTTEKKFQEVINEVPALFEAPQERVIAIYSPKHYKGPWLSKSDAAKRIESWQEHARDQLEKGDNSGRVILSLFDLTGNWAQPYADAGYDVRVFDIQNGADVNDFSAEWFAENLPEVSDVYGILIACPCTDFTVSGSQHWKKKDLNGKTEASKELVFQALRTVEFWRPKFWVLENPVGRIAELTGLPPARLTFQPNAFGEPYTKITQLWGKFNADLPVAPVKPTEGSKMHSKFGGSSQRTKNARSETPEGFAAAFFMANNYMDTPVTDRLTGEFPEAAGAIEKALESGFTEDQIREVVTDPYENYETDEARKAVRNLVKTGEPKGEPGVAGQDEDVGTAAAERPRKIKISKTKKGRKAASVEGMAEPTAEEREQSIAETELREAIEDETRAASEPQEEGVEEATDTEGSSRFKRQDEQIITPSTVRENLMNELGIDPAEFRRLGGEAQWKLAVQAIKQKYGYDGIFRHPGALLRNSVDHLLDAFESLQNMANAMGQGNKIVSLNGRVSLYMREKPGKTKGYFRHRGGLSGEPNNTIAIYNQEDVYSHELGHAIDYDLMERAGGMDPGGLSRMIRTRENTSALPNTLQEATADLMTALYYDGAAIAQLIKKAEHQLEKAGTPKRRAELTKRLKNLRSGAWTGRGSKTQFYLRAKDGPMAEYLTKPTELFARAFEAYISWKIQYQNELGLVKFLGATDAVYRDEADAWIARTYPQAQDRQQIFSAFDNLLGQLARENIYDTKGNPGWAQSKLNIGLMDPVAQAKAEGTALTPDIVRAHNLTTAAAETFVEDQIKLNDTLGKNWDQLIADLAAGKAGAPDKFHAAMKAITSTPDGIMAFLERRYPNLPSLRAIRDQLSDAAIHGRNKPVGVYREIQRQEASIRNRLEDRLKAVGVHANMPAKWSERMWDILHGYEKPANDAEKRQADQIRYELDYLWKLRDQTGEKIGFIDYEYLPRSFLRNIADDPRFHRDLLKLRAEEKQALIEKLEEQLQNAKSDEAQKALRKRIKEAEALNVRAMTAEQVGRMKGMKWGEPVYLGALSPDSGKERVFGPLADKILKDYYIKDPFTLLAGYGGAAARGMVMRRRFGETPNTVFQGWLDQAALGLPSAYADILLNAMQTSLGVRRDGNSTLARGVSALANVEVASMLGRSVLPNISEPLNILKSSFNSLNTFGSLVKAMMPAIFLSNTTQERYEAADRFGRLSGILVDAASSTTAMAQAMGEDVQGNGILARFSMRAYYFNMLSSLTAWQEKIVNRVGFEMFYEAARIVRKGGEDAGMYRQWLREHGIRDADAFATFLKDNRQLDGIKFENTIKPGSMELALSNALDHFGKTQIQKPTPSTKHIQAHNGLWGIAYRLTSWMTTNFINWAAYMKDKMMSGISGRYGADVVPLGNRLSIKGEYDGKKLTAGERFHGRVGGEQLTMGQRVGSMMLPVAASALAMYAAQATFLVARMYLTHHDEWEDRGEDFWERFSNPKTQLQILQYWGGLGWLMSTSIDATEATRFNRGATGTLLGPVYGGIAQDAERMIKLGIDQYAVSQGDKLPSVAVRNNAAQAVYHQASVLATVALLSVLPLQNRYSRAAGFLWSFFGTSPQAQHEFADLVAGEKDAALKQAADSSDVKARTPARKEIETRQREKERFDRDKERRDRQEKRQ